MNLTQAEAIATLYQELIDSIDATKIECPKRSYSETRFTPQQISSMHYEDGRIVVKWSAYAGCGEYDEDETYHSLESLFD